MHRACVAGRLDAELLAVSKRVSKVLQRLPRDITPVNLEELRRVKQTLVELESKADTLRCASATLLAAAPARRQATSSLCKMDAERGPEVHCIYDFALPRRCVYLMLPPRHMGP